MKFNKTIIITLLSFTIGFVSCEDDRLDEQSQIIVPIDPGKSPIKTEEELWASVNGTYLYLSKKEAFGSSILIHGDMISDNVFLSQTNMGYYREINSISWSGISSPFPQWNRLYDVVANANQSINADVKENERVKAMKAHGHVARGLAFFYLVNFFSANPTSGIHQDYGVPVYIGHYDPNGLYGRETVSKVYEQIISDLEKGLASIEDVPVNKGYFSKTTARFILSKVYLTRGESGDYDKALKLAKEVIDNAPASYALIEKDKLVDYYKEPNQAETLWELNITAQNTPGINESLGILYNPANLNAAILLRKSFYDGFPEEDVRKQLLDAKTPAPTTDNPAGVWTTKWQASQNSAIRIFRMTEALFVKWEAMYKLGQGAQALVELNEFAISRGGSAYSGVDVLNDILTEKKKEFFAEGTRYFDLKRNNLGFNKGTNCPTGLCSLEGTSEYFVAPVPSGSINLNPLMKQYPGYVNK